MVIRPGGVSAHAIAAIMRFPATAADAVMSHQAARRSRTRPASPRGEQSW